MIVLPAFHYFHHLKTNRIFPQRKLIHPFTPQHYSCLSPPLPPPFKAQPLLSEGQQSPPPSPTTTRDKQEAEITHSPHLPGHQWWGQQCDGCHKPLWSPPCGWVKWRRSVLIGGSGHQDPAGLCWLTPMPTPVHITITLYDVGYSITYLLLLSHQKAAQYDMWFNPSNSCNRSLPYRISHIQQPQHLAFSWIPAFCFFSCVPSHVWKIACCMKRHEKTLSILLI